MLVERARRVLALSFRTRGDSLLLGVCLPREAAASDLPLEKFVFWDWNGEDRGDNDAVVVEADSLDDLKQGRGNFFFDRETSVLYG